jgi:hypothetical protein
MRKYRIEERKFENNKSIFIPQHGHENKVNTGEPIHWNDFMSWADGKYVTKMFETFHDALLVIEKDKQSLSTPIEIIYHKII